MATLKTEKTRYSVICKCGHSMRVRRHHFGRMCRCTRCGFPIYVSYDNVYPPISPTDRSLFRCFQEREIPAYWERGDLLMELYEVRGVLGRGGMGVVYRVFHRGWGMDLAVKSPLAHLLRNPQTVRNFKQECETWVNLCPHPNTVCCHYVRCLGGIPRVFMEYVEGKSLNDHVKECGFASAEPGERLAHILDIAIQFAWGLAYAHSQGFIHCDVKPGNVLVAGDSDIKVTDFGLARALRPPGNNGNARDNGNQKSQPVGTPPYRSPEHRCSEAVTVQSDIWGWALSVLEMLVGGLRWEHGEEALPALDRCWKREEVRRLAPDDLTDLLRQCFESQPERRPATMYEVAQRLCQIYQARFSEAYDRPEPVERPASCDELNNRAVSLLDLGKVAESEALWHAVEMDNPFHFASHYNRHLHLWRMGRVTDVDLLRSLRGLCEKHPNEHEPRLLLARVLIEMGDSETAEQVMATMAAEDNTEREEAFTLALAQNRRKQDKRKLSAVHAHSTPITAVAISDDGKYAVTGCTEGRIRIWHLPDAECVGVLEGHKGAIRGLHFSADNTTVASGSEDCTLRIWSIPDGANRQVIRAHEDMVYAVCLDSKGRRVLSAGEDGKVVLSHGAQGYDIQTFAVSRGAWTSAVCFHAHQDAVVAGASNGDLLVWSIETGDLEMKLKCGNYPVNGLAMSQDPSLLLACAGNRLYIWELEKGSLVHSFEAHRGMIQSLSLQNEGRYALTATRHGTIRLWDIHKGQCLRTLPGRAPAAMSRDGRYALSGAPNGMITVWATHCGEETFAAPFMVCRGRGLRSSP